jgi:alanine racemase
MKETQALNTWVEISAAAYAHNLRTFRRLIGPEVELAVVLKANAYGHGWREIAELAIQHGAESFCVHSLEEALDLRQAGHGENILVMGPVPLSRLEEALCADLRLVTYDLQTVQTLAAISTKTGLPCRLHLKLETGTYRQGVEGDDFEKLLPILRSAPGLRLEGVYTHFANIEDTTRHAYAEAQEERFRHLLGRLAAAGFTDLLQHAACSAASLLFPRTHLGMVRLGIGQYGLWPSKETLLSYQILHAAEVAAVLKPVLSWKTRICQLKTAPAGSLIGYGCTYEATRESRLAVLPVGYSDGYDRLLSNRAHVLIGGRRAPLRGRVCMNLMMADVTDIPAVAVGDEAVLLGRQGEQEVAAGDLAEWASTIPYEVVARIRPSLRRIVVSEKLLR